MPETIAIDGRGNTIQEAVKEMWARMQPLAQKGYNPITGVEIVDAESKEILESYQVTDPDFLLHLQTDKQKQGEDKKSSVVEPPHAPERKGHFRYIARIKLA